MPPQTQFIVCGPHEPVNRKDAQGTYFGHQTPLFSQFLFLLVSTGHGGADFNSCQYCTTSVKVTKISNQHQRVTKMSSQSEKIMKVLYCYINTQEVLFYVAQQKKSGNFQISINQITICNYHRLGGYRKILQSSEQILNSPPKFLHTEWTSPV